MTGLQASLLLVGVAIVLARRRRRRRRLATRQLGVRRWHKASSFTLVTGIIAAVVFMPVVLATPAQALPFIDTSCKSAPAPETPGQTSTDFFDSDAIASKDDGTDYGKYGWAGLRWVNYDLGCGPDVVRNPAAWFDNTLGSAGLGLSKWITGFATWMDRQDSTDADGASGSTTVLGKFDQVVAAGSSALRSTFYEPWVGVAIVVVGIMVLWAAFKAAHGSALRQSLVAGVALFLCGMAVGMPMQTVHEVNKQVNASVSTVQDDALRKMGINPRTGPRQAIIDQIIVRQWLAGWFGDPDSATAKTLGPELRDSLALSWDDVAKQNKEWAALFTPGKKHSLDQLIAALRRIGAVSEQKKAEFVKIANDLQSAGGDAYDQFNDKTDNRTAAGWIAAIETLCVSMLWIAASVLRFVGMLIVQLAVLFAPVWGPVAIVSEKILGTLIRFVGSALVWAVIAAAAVAVDLVALTGIYSKTDLAAGWKVFVMVLISVVIWMILRPYKRLFALLSRNAAPRFNLRRLATTMLAGGMGGRLATRGDREQKRSDEPAIPKPRSIPSEGIYRWSATRLPQTRLMLDNQASSTSKLTDPPRELEQRWRAQLPPGTSGNLPARRDVTTRPSGQPVAPTGQPGGRGTDRSRSDTPSANPASGSDDNATAGRGRVVMVDDRGRVLDVVDDVYEPGQRRRSEPRVGATGDLVYDVYTPTASGPR